MSTDKSVSSVPPLTESAAESATENITESITESITEGEKPALFLKFDASLVAPNYMGIFMETGGSIDAMAARWQTDLSLSGSDVATAITFHDQHTTEVSLELSSKQYDVIGKHEVCLPSEMRLNGMTQRMCAAINGTIVHSLSGETSEFLFNIFQSGTHYQMGMTYKTFLSHASTLAVSNVRLVAVDEEGNEVRYKPHFEQMPDNRKQILEGAAKLTEQYVKAGFSTRQQVVYPASPMLHKTVFSEIVGVDGRGYNLLHAIMDRDAYVSLETLNALYEAAIACECCQDKNEIQTFLSATNAPGLQAAMEARTVASATSLIVNVLMSYRADGRNVVSSKGAAFESVENWNASVPRSCLEANDCDGLALLAVSLIRTALKLTPDQLNDPKYMYLRSVRNAVFPHYQLGLSVIGASAAEANSADANHSKVAGHAITVLIPSLSLLRAMAKVVAKQVGKDGPVMFPEVLIGEVNKARFNALYPAATLDLLPQNEKDLLKNWNTAQHEFTQLASFAIEGTTPASPVLYISNPERRTQSEKNANLDKQVFSKSAPNVFRSIKVLHVGGSANGSTHVFYSDLVELTLPPDSPLWTDQTLRSMTAAATQYLLTTDLEAADMTKCGCTPRQLVMEEYGAFPIVRVNEQLGYVLDTATSVAKLDVVPPRPREPLQLSEYQSKTLAESMQYVAELEDMLAKRTQANEVMEHHHCVAYVCAMNTLVHNPTGVKQFVETLKRVAVSGVVDKRVIPGLARDTDGNEVGLFLHLDVYCPV